MKNLIFNILITLIISICVNILYVSIYFSNFEYDLGLIPVSIFNFKILFSSFIIFGIVIIIPNFFNKKFKKMILITQILIIVFAIFLIIRWANYQTNLIKNNPEMNTTIIQGDEIFKGKYIDQNDEVIVMYTELEKSFFAAVIPILLNN